MISANIITLNEEKNIQACIESVVQVCDQVIVVDSGSTDRTVDIARQMGAIVVEQQYLGDGFQKNIALNYVKNDWILCLDADERLHIDLIKFIKNLDLSESKVDAFAFRRRNMIGSRWIKHCGWYPDYCIRLYNSKKTKFAEVKQHAKVTSRNVICVKKDIIHYSFKNIGELFSKPGRNFSNRAAKIMYLKGTKVNSFSPLVHGLIAFVRKYLLQRGFLAGIDGVTVALSSSVNSYLKYAKLLELKRDPAVLKHVDFDEIW
jgi:glycosyltransferase involved in cell wall biosynthesis